MIESKGQMPSKILAKDIPLLTGGMTKKKSPPISIAEQIEKVKRSSPSKDTKKSTKKSTKLFLSHEESAQLAANHAKNEILKQEKKLMELRNLLITSQENTLKRDKIILNNDMNNIKITEDNFKKENEIFLQKITKKYDRLENGNWGYSTKTGEIVIK